MARKISRFGIRKKIVLSLVIFVTLSLFSTILISLWSFDSIGDLGADISSDALESQAESHLKKETEDIALNIDTKLKNVQSSVEMFAKTAENIWETPDAFPYRVSYYHDKRLADAPPDVFYDSTRGYNREISLEYSCFKLPSDIYTPENLKNYETSINNSAKLDFILKELKKQNDQLLWVYMGQETGVHRSYPWHGPYTPDYDPRVRSWYQDAKDAHGEVVWGTPYTDINPPYPLLISCSKAVYANNKLVGVVSIDLEIDDIKDTILNFDFLTSGYAFLIDPDLTTIAHKDLQTVGTAITDLEDDSPEFNNVLTLMSGLNSGVSRITTENSDRFISYAPINSTGYILGIIVPASEILEHANELRTDVKNKSNEIATTFLLIGIIVITITGLTAFLLGTTVVRPIKRLTDIASKIGTGELKIKEVEENLAKMSDKSVVSPNRSDEIGQLTKTFGEMLKAIKEDMIKQKETPKVVNITIKDSVVYKSAVGASNNSKHATITNDINFKRTS